jgi:hypothetical protein
MPKRILPLSDMKVVKVKPQSKQVTLFDGDGLFLLVTPSGGKLWRLKYRFGGKEKLLSWGAYPEISLANARGRRDKARKQLANGIDPGEVRKAQKAAQVASCENSFEVVAREWHKKFSPNWSNIPYRHGTKSVATRCFSVDR